MFYVHMLPSNMYIYNGTESWGSLEHSCLLFLKLYFLSRKPTSLVKLLHFHNYSNYNIVRCMGCCTSEWMLRFNGLTAVVETVLNLFPVKPCYSVVVFTKIKIFTKIKLFCICYFILCKYYCYLPTLSSSTTQ